MKECLFCLKFCSSPPILPEIIGASNCKSLEDQLLQHFVLRNLLDIPWSWCEESLKLHGESGLPKLLTCRKCSEMVYDSWQIHQKLVGLEVRLKQMKEDIKGIMLESIEKLGKRKKGNKEDWKNKIRMLIFPDEMDDQTHPKWLSEDIKAEEDEFFGTYSDDDRMECDPSEDPLGEDRPSKKIQHVLRLKKRKKKLLALKKNRTRLIMVRDDKKIKCNICPAKFINKEELQSHLDTHCESKELGLECETCSYPARTSEELEIHTFNDHNKEIKKFCRPFECGVEGCDFKSDVWKTVKDHADKEHPDTPPEELGPDLQLKCVPCSKFFDTANTLINHQKKMHPELFGAPLEPIQCDQCSMLLPSRIHLQYHLKSLHKRLNSFICDTCGKGFSHQRRLDRHKVVHEDKHDFICHLCGCSYSYKSSLSVHYKKFHPELEQATTILNHPSIDAKPNVTDSGEEFSCKYCDLKFPFKITMLRHMKTHKETIGVQCELCSKYYVNMQGLRQHMKLSHSSSDQQTQCPHCFKVFSNPHAMHTHSMKHCKIKKINEGHTQQPQPEPPASVQIIKEEVMLSTPQPLDISQSPDAPTSVVFHLPV